MAHVFRGVLEAMCVGKNKITQECIEKAKSSIGRATNEREKSHLEALIAWTERKYITSPPSFSRKRLATSVDIWEKILIQYPADILALKFVNDAYFYLGDSVNIRDSVARVYPFWKNTFSSLQMFGYIQGM